MRRSRESALPCSHDDAGLVLKASIAAGTARTPRRFALNAIVEHPDGGLSVLGAWPFPRGRKARIPLRSLSQTLIIRNARTRRSPRRKAH